MQAESLWQTLGLAAADKPAPATPAAQAAAAKSLGQPPADLGVSIHDAETLRKNGDLAGAARTLGQLVLYAPDDPRVLGEYGKTLAAEGRSDDALAFLERAIQLQPGDWSLYSAQGVAYDQKGDFQAALAYYWLSPELKPNEPTVLNNAALSRMQAGDLAGAEKLLQQAAPGSTQFPRIAQNLALVQSLKTSKTADAATAAAPAALAAASVPAATAEAKTPAHSTTLPFFAAAAKASASVTDAAPPAPAQTVTVADATPPTATAMPKTLSQLQADPSVRVAPLPKADAPAIQPKANQITPPAQHLAQAAPPKPARSSASNASYYLQAGAFLSQSRAEQAAATLDSLGARVQPATVDGRAIFRVRIGPFLDISQANAAVNQAQSMGHTDLKIVTE